MTLEYLEKATIQQALKFYQGNKTLTSRALGCAINTINAKLAKYEEEDRDVKRQADAEERARLEFGRRQRGGQPPGTGDIPQGRDAFGQTPFQNKAAGEVGLSDANPGLQLEPAVEAPAKSAVPVPERKEVQAVLSKSTGKGGKK